MSRRTLTLVAALAATTAALPAQAQSSDQTVKCLLAANIFTKVENDPAKKQGAVGALFFYMGRLGANVAPAQLKAQIVAQGKTLNQQNLGPTMNECVKQIAARQQMMQTISQQIAPAQLKKTP